MTNDGAAEKDFKETTNSSDRRLKTARLAATLAVLAACSAPACNGVVSLGRNNGTAKGSSGASDASARLSNGPGFGVGGSGPTASSETGGTVIFRDGGPSAAEGPDASQCAALSQKPETIVVYRDATVTDTVVTHRPAAILFMVDRSSGMTPGAWTAAAAGIGAFVDDAASISLDIGIGAFPADNADAGTCDGTACGTLDVPINSLPENQGPIHAFLSLPPPGAGIDRPTECGLRAMNDLCLNYMANSPTGEQCVGVLVTNGSPTACDTNYADLTAIVADGHSKGVTTFVLALPGADPSGLDALASAGGTNKATLVGGGTQALEQTLDAIRSELTRIVTTVVTTTRIPEVIHTVLPCEFSLPPQVFGQMYDLSNVNVLFTPITGPAETFNYVSSEADCARSSTGAWYYDNAQDPKKIILCPDTCARIKNSGGGMEIVVGCFI